jgi:hypothetical protein
MNQYRITLSGTSPLLLHRDNLAFSESVKSWRDAPENKGNSVAGDDRSPAWTWIGCLYHNKRVLGIDSDCIMTCLREGGAKVKTGKMSETYKKHTQSGLMVDQEQFTLLIDGKEIPVDWIDALVHNNNFIEHEEAVEAHGFELMIKRAKINGKSKHVRVRPLFRNWTAIGSVTVFDEEYSGLTMPVLELILNQSGALCGIGDWRPSSKTPGSFGKFAPTVARM